MQEQRIVRSRRWKSRASGLALLGDPIFLITSIILVTSGANRACTRPLRNLCLSVSLSLSLSLSLYLYLYLYLSLSPSLWHYAAH